MITVKGFDLVSGWKKKRYDNVLTKNLPSKLFNATTSFVSGIKLHDFNCGLKAYRNTVVKSIEVYGEMHRYIPVLAKQSGFKNIGEKAVHHQARKYGSTKFGGLQRFTNGLLDLMSITFMGKFGKRPMHFFGSLGLLSFFLGSLATLYLIFEKIFLHDPNHSRNITEKPLFYLALVAIIVGSQMFLAGFLGELISRSSPERNNYKIKETIR
jgi:hypothetical protein